MLIKVYESGQGWGETESARDGDGWNGREKAMECGGEGDKTGCGGAKQGRAGRGRGEDEGFYNKDNLR